MSVFSLVLGLWSGDAKVSALALALLVPFAAASPSPSASTCANMKQAYKDSACCGQPAKVSGFQVVPMPSTMIGGTNVCAGKKPTSTAYDNFNCTVGGVVQAVEQAGTDVTSGYQGSLVTSAVPVTVPYYQAGLCPVNVHWHLGAEHRSNGEYDESGTGPSGQGGADDVRQGLRCHKYNAADPKFTTAYAWQYCLEIEVGQTYEVHWPHSAAGACGTPNQYQTPFYDGVFCRDNVITNTSAQIGVQAQVFTIVNDEAYFYADLMRGMIVDGVYGADIAKYTGSTTGTSRNNEICSAYTPITWQVDRKCQLISASSFDKMCADMKSQRDDLSGDLHPHGARELVADTLASNNHVRRLQEMHA